MVEKDENALSKGTERELSTYLDVEKDDVGSLGIDESIKKFLGK